MNAPRVVAKGVDYLAQQIRQIAREHNVPIVEDPPLARALYTSCDIDQEIPETLFRAVARVLAYVYRLRKQSRIPVGR
jgi:flagellar biosynthetic protein FlhB